MTRFFRFCLVMWLLSFNVFAKSLTWKSHINAANLMIYKGQPKEAVRYLEIQSQRKDLTLTDRLIVAIKMINVANNLDVECQTVSIIKPIYDESAKINGLGNYTTFLANRYLIKAYVLERDYDNAFKFAFLLLKSASSIGMKAQSNLVIADLYLNQKHNKKAEKYYRSALEFFEKINKRRKYNKDISFIYNNLAVAYGSDGDYQKKLDLYFKSLQFKDKNSEGYFITLFNIGVSYYSLGKLQEAKIYLEQVDSHYSKVNEGNNLFYIEIVNLLGIIEHENEHFEAALDLYKKLYELSKKLKQEYYEAKALNNIATIYRVQGRLSLAEINYQKALAIRQKLSLQKDLVNSYENLALLAAAKKDYPSEQSYYQKALGILEDLHEQEHPRYANILANMAMGYQSRKQFDKAEQNYKRALIILKKSQKSGLKRAFVMTNLASMYVKTHQYDKAEPLFLEAIDIQHRLVGDKHPDVAYTYNNAARLYSLLNQGKKSVEFYKKAVSVSKATAGPNHPSTKGYRRNLLKARINSFF